MAWRGLHLSRPGRLSLANGQCVVQQEAGETRVPLEDVAWIILDTPQATLTAALLAACMEAGVAVIVTDERHHPSGMALPFHRHHRQAEVASLQVTAGEGLRNRLWQTVVRVKLRNQAAVLDHCSGNGHILRAMSERVAPGDPDNVEARGARHYWSRLFARFVRDDGSDRRNAMLNYGYAVMRAAVARGLVAAGLLPALGLHHASALNPFNLADDLLEPFRPVVDRLVWRLSDSGMQREGEVTLEHRRSLAAVLLEPVGFERETVTALVATEMTAVALVRAFHGASAKLLSLPSVNIPPA
jgi:CRISPR-associated protein Cas1